MQYFAYGTLLDSEYMRKYCPSAQPLGVMRLEGYELGFAKCSDPGRGGCTLDAAPDGHVLGVLYELSAEDMANLEAISGLPEGLWAKKRVSVRDASGSVVETDTFVVPNSSGPHAPPDSYVAPIYRGAEEFAFPDAYVDRLRAIISRSQSVAAG